MSQAIIATKGVGTALKIDGVEIGEVRGLPSAGGGETGQVEVTHLRSAAKEFLADLPDNGEISFPVNLVPSDPGQRLLNKARIDQTTHTFTIEFPYSPPMVLSFQGTVTQFAYTAALSEAITANATIRVTGAITGFPEPGS